MAAASVRRDVGRIDPAALARTRRRLLHDGRIPWLHEEAARRMAERLPLVKLQPDRILDWSGPLGGGASLLRAAYPGARCSAVAVDDRQPPTQTGPRRWWPFARRGASFDECLRADAVQAGQAQLLWSNMALHAVIDAGPLFAHWHAALAVGGFLMFSTLGPGTLAELRDLYRVRGWSFPMAELVDMHDLGDALVRAGFSDPVMDQETLTLTWPDADCALAELRGFGANLSPGRFAGLRTPGWRSRLAAALGELRPDGKPALSVELVYGHAFKAAPRAAVRAETSIPLADLRAQVRRRERDPL